MEVYIYFLLAAVILVIIKLISRNSAEHETRHYSYTKKERIMSRTESDFYLKLQNIIGQKFVILPQAHISLFLDHRIKGQNWKGAFSRINGKSVDYLVCEKEGLKPVFAIELDDYSHDREDRVIRDEFVNSIFRESNMVLVRFRQGEWDDEQAIYSKIKSVAMQTNPSEPHE